MTSMVFTSVMDIYDEMDILDEEGVFVSREKCLVKKNVKLRTQIYLDDIKRLEEVMTERCNIKKGFTKLYLDTGESIVVKEDFSNMQKMLSTKQIGFKYGKQ